MYCVSSAEKCWINISYKHAKKPKKSRYYNMALKHWGICPSTSSPNNPDVSANIFLPDLESSFDEDLSSLLLVDPSIENITADSINLPAPVDYSNTSGFASTSFYGSNHAQPRIIANLSIDTDDDIEASHNITGFQTFAGDVENLSLQLSESEGDIEELHGEKEKCDQINLN